MSIRLSSSPGRAPHGARGLKFMSCEMLRKKNKSRPAWGAWIEIFVWPRFAPAPQSRPAWGAWIEITAPKSAENRLFRRAPHGARGLKSYLLGNGVTFAGRAPHGARGLKFHVDVSKKLITKSRPAWGAWIEIQKQGFYGDFLDCRAPHGARGLKLLILVLLLRLMLSRPAWGAWIEIL